MPRSLSVTIEAKNNKIKKILLYSKPLAKSNDLRYGSMVRTDDLYPGLFSRGFLNKNKFSDLKTLQLIISPMQCQRIQIWQSFELGQVIKGRYFVAMKIDHFQVWKSKI